MSGPMVALLSVVVGAVVYCLFLWMEDRRHKRESAERLWQKKAESSEAMSDKSLAGFSKAVEEAQAWKTKAEGYFRGCESLERERNVWKDLYHTAGLEFSAAQEMMLREITRLSLLAKVEVSTHLRDMAGGYRERHGSGLEEQEKKAAAARDKPAAG